MSDETRGNAFTIRAEDGVRERINLTLGRFGCSAVTHCCYDSAASLRPNSVAAHLNALLT